MISWVRNLERAWLGNSFIPCVINRSQLMTFTWWRVQDGFTYKCLGRDGCKAGLSWNCKLEKLCMASPAGWSQGIWILTCSSGLQEPLFPQTRRYCMVFGPASEVTPHHDPCLGAIKMVISLPDSRGRDVDLISWMGEASKLAALF